MNNQIVKSSFEKILLLIGILFILLDLFMISITPSQSGYEISIYNVFPFYFWLFIMFSISCGIIIMVKQAFTEKKSNLWVMGFFLILFTNCLVLMLPLIRGYLTYGRADVLTHIGFIQDIISTGHFGAMDSAVPNLYPVIHILSVSIYYFTGISPDLLAETLPIFFIIFYMVSIYLFSRALTSNKGQAILITAFGSLLLFKAENLMLAPSVQAFFLLPFILFIYIKSKKSDNQKVYSVLLLVLLILLPFLHPGEGSLFLLVILTLMDISMLFIYLINNKLAIISSFKHMSLKNSLNVSLILFIAWFTWLSSFSIFGTRISSIANWLVNEVGTTTASQYLDTLSNAQLTLFQFVDLFVKSYGQDILYCLLATIIVLILIKEILHKKYFVDKNITAFSFIFIIFMIIMAICFIGIFGVDFNRVMRYVIFSATILSGLGFYKLYTITKHKKALKITLISVLIISSSICVFNTFPSPIVRDANYQVTQMELSGVNWFFNYRDANYSIETIDPRTVVRMIHGLYGAEFDMSNVAIPKTEFHFGYTNESYYGESLYSKKNYSYYLDMKFWRVFYPEIYPEYQTQWKYTPNDFYRLNNDDNSVDMVYSNGEFWTYYVKSRSN